MKMSSYYVEFGGIDLPYSSLYVVYGLDNKSRYYGAMCKLLTIMTQSGKYTSRVCKRTTQSHCHDDCVQCVCFSSCAATVTAVYATSFTMDFPFDPQELIVFAVIGWVTVHFCLKEECGVLQIRNYNAWICYNYFICMFTSCFVFMWNLISL
jgi:hypothetical protein